eukprot:CAMPEP_0182418216 /NCGR_PEP_ID=MMETSP1167-20130531/2703_1 /TAXON_ID=2988 /ORGANISM="Mallomonas Sp, Strain CCMP3275" /LENGTH=134 /DNA_ID=CAMNT_0024592325 /DNA_START=149 /DNA_END=553 /DNA_ORIENTATION=+
MGEAFLAAACGDAAKVYSAGSKPVGYVHPKAIQVMGEVGIDISDHTSKHLDEFLGQQIDVVITVCGRADQACPTFPGQSVKYHWGFDDPAHIEGTEEHILSEFRRVRDEIRRVFEAFAENVKAGSIDPPFGGNI